MRPWSERRIVIYPRSPRVLWVLAFLAGAFVGGVLVAVAAFVGRM